MSFFLRKSFRAGPIRLNLSKSGLGVSAGVTGARLGINKNGAYVHGGRHGLYYREQLGKRQRQATGRGVGVEGAEDEAAAPGTVERFVDTGRTFDPLVEPNDLPPIEVPALPSAWNRTAVGLGVSLLGMVIAGYLGPIALAVALTLPFVAVGYGALERWRNQKAEAELQRGLEALDHHGDPRPALQAPSATRLGPAQRAWLEFQLYEALVHRATEDDDAVTAEDLRGFEAATALPGDVQDAVKADAFTALLDALLADHHLTEAEEAALRRLADRLRLDDAVIGEELETINVMAIFREELAGDLAPVDADVRLKQGETCYFAGRGRQLVARIQQRFQRDHVQYKEVGYETDMDGQIYLTDRRILLVGDGSRSYRIGRVLDEELSLEDNTVRLTLENRKNPVILTLPNAPVFAARLQKLLTETA
ncbi:MAG: DUF4236 domain-containing protein [Bacteroidetes bacterium]|jgi:uncharacterized membrane protein YebE (DUF533 family)|nr:DUF4236 domain-containing protein [Bacteroidota bacterium]